MLRSFPNSLRGRILLSHLGLFALTLVGLGIFQSSVLSSYLHDAAANSIAQPARNELEVLGPCFVRSSKELHRNAQVLAQLLGSGNTGVKIDSPATGTQPGSGGGVLERGVGPVARAGDVASPPFVTRAASLHRLPSSEVRT